MAWFKLSGQRGKRSVDERLQGIAPLLFDYAHGHTVLDLGCAEGMISLEMMKRGAVLTHGVDSLPERVATARAIFAKEGHKARFWCADVAAVAELDLAESYDVILLLGILHKLRRPEELIAFAARRATGMIAIRVPTPKMESGDIRALLAPRFHLIHEAGPKRSNRLGWSGMFVRGPHPG